MDNFPSADRKDYATSHEAKNDKKPNYFEQTAAHFKLSKRSHRDRKIRQK